MGHSWGGIVMLAAAAQRPLDVSALVLLDSGQHDYADRPGTHPEWSLEDRAAAIAAAQPAYADRADLLRQIQDDLRRPLTAAYTAGIGRHCGRRPPGRSNRWSRRSPGPPRRTACCASGRWIAGRRWPQPGSRLCCCSRPSRSRCGSPTAGGTGRPRTPPGGRRAPDVWLGPRPDRRRRARPGRGHRRLADDELRLAAVAPRRHDAAPGRLVGDLAAVVAAHQVQAQVDAGGDAGRGQHVAVVDEQHVRVERDLREAARGTARRGPVRGRRPAVEQAGRGQHERAGADRHQSASRPAVCGRSAVGAPSGVSRRRATSRRRRRPARSPCRPSRAISEPVVGDAPRSRPTCGPVRRPAVQTRTSYSRSPGASRAAPRTWAGVPRSKATTSVQGEHRDPVRRSVMAGFLHMVAVRPLVRDRRSATQAGPVTDARHRRDRAPRCTAPGWWPPSRSWR